MRGVLRWSACCWDYCNTPGLRGSAYATVLSTQLCAASKPDSEGDGHRLRLTVAPPLNVASTAALVRDAPRSGHEPGIKAVTADVAMDSAMGPAFLLCYTVIGLLLRLRPNHWGAFGLGVALHGCKLCRARGTCVWRRAAGRPRPASASRGQRFGVRRAVPLLLLAAWLGVCSANDLAHVPPTRSDRLDWTQLGSNRGPALIRRQAEPPEMVDPSSTATLTQSGRRSMRTSSTSSPTSGTICG